jgi:hypothetical protein
MELTRGQKIIGIIICLIVIVGLALGLGLGLGLKKDGGSSLSPKDTLLASGQAIQVPEAEISTAPPAFTAPTGIDASKVSYSMTMDVQIAQAGPSWRNILNNGDPDWPPGTVSRRPAVFITGNDAAPPNRIHIVHGSTEDQNRNIVTAFAATPGTYFNLTWVVDGGKMTTYINGVKDAKGDVTGTFTWGTNAWKWNAYLTQYPTRKENTAGSVKVKNAYWFNKALSDADIATLTGAPAPATTTSKYTPEPFSK